MSEPNLPVHTLRHRGLKVAIWRNRSEKGPHYSVTASRSYRDGETWKDSHSFSYDEIMNLAKLLFDAHSYISNLRIEERQAKPSTPPPAADPGRSHVRTRRSDKPA
jgi:hypothetical protein